MLRPFRLTLLSLRTNSRGHHMQMEHTWRWYLYVHSQGKARYSLIDQLK